MKIIKIVNEDTLDMEDFILEDDEEEVKDKELDDDKIVNMFSEIFNGSTEEFSQKYKAYKRAKKEFDELYEPIKKNIIELHKKYSGLPKTVVYGGAKFTYVSPSTRTTIDSKKLKEEEPELYKKFTKTTNVSATIRLEDSHII